MQFASNSSRKTSRNDSSLRKKAKALVSSLRGRVGAPALVRFSTDGGSSWRPAEGETFPELSTFMRDIAFDPTGRVGFIVGQTGKILRTEDSGISWSFVLPPPEA